MAPSPEEEFSAYDWQSSPAWQRYFETLYPVPPADKIEKFKRKFFKSQVNSALSLQPPAAPEPTRPAERRSTPRAVATHQRVWTPIATALLALAVASVLGSFLPLAAHALLAKIGRVLLGLGFVAATFSENGLPRRDLQYWQLLLYNTNMQGLLMLLGGLLLRNALTLYSPAITGAGYVAKAFGFEHPLLTRLKLNKPYLEILVGVCSVVFVLMRTGPFLGALMYWNALRILYAINAPSKRAFANVHAGILKCLQHPKVPARVCSAYVSATNWIHAKCEPTA